ncbi:hypothetical protein CRD59_06945 [Bifidobacterium xylocopae]|uniref:ABC transporter domain-containing protein n=1 Tax=Bifidobacterium xylocopae TaxID=2493119 RepID=A0A366KDW5_9BIFI|nr:hypothetical protein CRD59_06945 [Bifidobacterium xylocopae]
MIEIEGLTKRFGAKTAIDGVSFTAEDGKVTGFLGPNGAGKSTTMRAALGLIRPDSGAALIDGRPFAGMHSPMSEVGAVLGPRSAHKGRTARAHLLGLAYSNGIPAARVDQVMAIAGISGVGRKPAGSFSLGMGQRLSIAAALLGDPRNLIFDEPVNGLDPEGVVWVRQLCRYYASQGRAVLLSSHLMSEVAQTADDLVIIGRGRVLERTSVAEFLAKHSSRSVRVVTPEGDRLRGLVMDASQGRARVEDLPPSGSLPADVREFKVTGMELTALARLVAARSLVVYEFRQEQASLEEAYMALTHGYEEYRTGALPGPGRAQGPVRVQAAANPSGQGYQQGARLSDAERAGQPGRTAIARAVPDSRFMRPSRPMPAGQPQPQIQRQMAGPAVAAQRSAIQPPPAQQLTGPGRHRKMGGYCPALGEPEAPAHYHVPPIPAVSPRMLQDTTGYTAQSTWRPAHAAGHSRSGQSWQVGQSTATNQPGQPGQWQRAWQDGQEGGSQ